MALRGFGILVHHLSSLTGDNPGDVMCTIVRVGSLCRVVCLSICQYFYNAMLTHESKFDCILAHCSSVIEPLATLAYMA
jgi:hypothetical protein